MAYLNKVFLIGNLTRDPELRVTPKGTSICQFSLAVNRQFKDESGQSRDETTFVDIEAWGKQADLEAKHRTVIGRGKISFLSDPKEKAAGLDLIVAKFTPKKFEYPASKLDHTAVAKITILSLQGKKHGC